MAYVTGTALDADDLLDKLRIFLLANGWTVDFWGVRTSTAGRALSVHKGATFGTFFSATTVAGGSNPGPWISTATHASYAVNADPDILPSRSELQHTNKMGGPYKAHWFYEGAAGGFAPSNYVYVVVETTTGFFKHFALGTMECEYALTNGGFATASSWYYGHFSITEDQNNEYSGRPFVVSQAYQGAGYSGTVVRADSDAISPRFFNSGLSGVTHSLRTGGRTDENGTGFISLLMRAQPSDETGRNVLLPFVTAVERPAGYWSHIGNPPNLRYVDVTYLEPGEEITIGGDVWMAFPQHRKIALADAAYSGSYGYAYLKN